MNAETAVTLAESSEELQAVLINGIHAVVGRKSAEKAELRGVEFGYLYRHEGKVTCIPGYELRDQDR